MTRPEIIRADTLDLQDKTSPTAADHSASPHPAPLGVGPAAPHQQATLRQVEDERSTQEKGIWESKGLRDEPGSDDEMVGDEDNSARLLNGGIGGEGNDTEVVDGEDDDYDDMDRISSSPSISDEGRYSLPSYYQKPREQAPPSVESTPVASSSPACASSSPFTDTPLHMPLSATAARRSSRVPAGGAETASSPPLFPLSTNGKSEVHHHGEYWTWTTNGPPDQAMEGQLCDPSPWTQHLTEVETRLQDFHSSSTSSMFSEVDVFLSQSMLQPISGPAEHVLEDPFTDKLKWSSMPTIDDQGESNASGSDDMLPGSSSDDEGSWTTDSDIDSVEFQDDETTDDISFPDDPRFIDFGFGGECLQELADIDFQSVYALHTFVATVEGQANATKGDTMVLLDDSNSYWWLVRVVKDSSIGYLPAEHIETPTERLARLNKHRNIDLSATMLGDTAEKTKNPLKKAMRRRNAKTVQFGPPEYVEASDYDYSSDEGGDEELFGGADPNQAQGQQQQQQAGNDKSNEPEQDDGMKVQPLKVNGSKKEAATNAEAEGKDISEDAGKSEVRPSNELSEQPLDPKVSRNGTMRNTDSFFKDDSTETRKITLTPNLLRDDSSTSTTGSRERGPSLESLEKTGFADKVKDKEKKKEKKPGMLSGLFKRKDKKAKGALESFDSDTEKQSDEFGRNSPQSKPDDGTSSERPSTDQPSPQRQPSKGKLQKPQRANSDAPIRTKSILKTDSPEPSMVQTSTGKEPNNKPVSQSTSTMRLVAPESDETANPSTDASGSPLDGGSRSNSAASKLNPSNMMKTQHDTEPKPEKVKKAKQRVQLDDFDSDEDQKDPFSDPEVRTQTAQRSEPDPSGRLSESPVHVSAADAQPSEKESGHDKDHESDSHPPGLTGDTSSQDTSSPISTPTPDDNPSTTQPTKSDPSSSQPRTTAPSTHATPPTTLPLTIPQPSRPAPTPKEIGASPPDSSESTSLPAWSDSSLRNYLDDGSEIRDMLLVINDTTGVVPVGADHPIMARFCVEEQKTMSGLSSELDSLLNGLLEKRLKRSKSASPSVLKAGR